MNSQSQAPSKQPPVIAMRGVNKYFGALHVLNDINLSVSRGEVLVVLGPSGSGKSTLCRTLNRLEDINSGTIEINGTPIPAEGRELANFRAKIGMVFQQFNLFPHKTVLENVTFGPIRVKKESKDTVTKRALALLDRVGVANQAAKLPWQLSGGQQQRVAIARALAMQPELMLFDEATSALDPEMVFEVLQVMQDLAAEGMTMVVVTHHMGFAKASANRIIFMADGRILEDTDPQRFFSDQCGERARDFLQRIRLVD